MVFFLFLTVNSQRVKYNFNSDWRVFVGDDADASGKNFDDSK